LETANGFAIVASCCGGGAHPFYRWVVAELGEIGWRARDHLDPQVAHLVRGVLAPHDAARR